MLWIEGLVKLQTTVGKEFHSKQYVNFPNCPEAMIMPIYNLQSSFEKTESDTSQVLYLSGLASWYVWWHKWLKKALRNMHLKFCRTLGKAWQTWVNGLHEDFVSDFNRLRKLGIKFGHSILRVHALRFLQHADFNVFSNNIIFSYSNGPPHIHLTCRCIQVFTGWHCIVSRSHTAQYTVSSVKKL